MRQLTRGPLLYHRAAFLPFGNQRTSACPPFRQLHPSCAPPFPPSAKTRCRASQSAKYSSLIQSPRTRSFLFHLAYCIRLGEEKQIIKRQQAQRVTNIPEFLYPAEMVTGLSFSSFVSGNRILCLPLSPARTVEPFLQGSPF